MSRDQQGTLTEDAGTDQERLPADDPALASRLFDLDGLAAHWAARAALPPMTAEQIRGADARAQRLGISGDRLMEQAGAAVAAAARAMVRTTQREAVGPILILCGPGNNGGDGLVAARRLSASGIPTVVALVSADARPAAPDAARNWDRLAGSPDVERIHVSAPRDVRILMAGAERASIVVDALLGTGTTGSLREPIRTTVELLERARAAGVPVLAVDTPTSLDLTSGVPSMPVVHADATITFHRPKVGLRGREGRVLAGQVLVAPIGIPPEADPG